MTTPKELRELLAAKRHDEVIAAVNALADPGLDLVDLRGQALLAMGEVQMALRDFQRILAAQSVAAPFPTYQRARGAVQTLAFSPAEAEAFWLSCSDAGSRAAADLAQRLLSGETAGLVDDFAAVLAGIHKDPALIASWTAAFDLLVRGLSGEVQPPHAGRPARRKIIVSGMGWSGSGAIFDYLKEYDEIVAVKGESSVIEGDGAFRSFVTTRDRSRAGYADLAVTFFFRNMLGYFPMQSASCFKELRSARGSNHHPTHAAAYAAGAIEVVRALLQLIQGCEGGAAQTEAHLHRLCDTIMDNLIVFDAPVDKILVLDNCIHIQNIRLLNYVSNTIQICCTRDPRTNYIALRRESAGYNKTPAEFIASTRTALERLAKTADAAMHQRLAANNSQLVNVQFEEFIASQPFRRSLAALAGITTAPAREFAFFQPWVSFRNTQLHINYEHPEEMAEIAAALPDLCMDYTVRACS